MLGKLLQPEIQELIESRQFGQLRGAMAELHPGDIADLLSDLDPGGQAVVFRLLPVGMAADTFEFMDLDAQKALLHSLGREDVARVLNEMSPDDRTALLEELPGPLVKGLLDLLTPEERRISKSLLGYPEDSVGRLMTPEYIAIKAEWTVNKVLEHIRARGREVESLDVLYVIDERGRLLDDIAIRDVLLASARTKVAKLMNEKFISLSVNQTQEQALEAFRKYGRLALPVVDSSNFLIGAVTIDDVLAVAEEADTEDIQKFGGVEALDYPYIATPLLKLVQHRAGWLVFLFLGEMLTATAMGFFEKEIARAVVLALFVPLIISSGGNSGSQAATLIIRAMALGEVRLRDWWRVMRREVLSGLMLGAILGCIGFLRIAIWSAFTNLYGPHWPLVAMTVGFSLVGVVLWGTVVGSMLPFVLRRLGFDPASSSAPFVATLVDVSGLIIYFSVAAAILRGSLL